TRPGWHYFALYTIVVTPIVISLLATAGGLWRGVERREWKSWLIVLAWLGAPYVIGRSPVRQDGVRYVLAVLVPIAVMAGAGLEQLGDAFRRPRAPMVVAGAMT